MAVELADLWVVNLAVSKVVSLAVQSVGLKVVRKAEMTVGNLVDPMVGCSVA